MAVYIWVIFSGYFLENKLKGRKIEARRQFKMPLNNLVGMWWWQLEQDFRIEGNNIWLKSGYISRMKPKRLVRRLNTAYEREREKSRMPNYFGWVIVRVGLMSPEMEMMARETGDYLNLSWFRYWFDMGLETLLDSWIYETGVQGKDSFWKFELVYWYYYKIKLSSHPKLISQGDRISKIN